MSEKNDKKRQISATVSMSAGDKEALSIAAKEAGTSLSAFIVEGALMRSSISTMKKLVVNLDKEDGFILMASWMTAEDLKKAAQMLALMEGPVLPSEESAAE